MLVIINADDLGASQEINDAVFDLMSAGLISSSSLIANSMFVESAAERARGFTDVSFGVHLNLTEFSPLSSSDGINTILNRNNDFAGQSKLLRTSITRSLCNSIYLEFCSQVEKLLSLGIEISHIDSHEHIHTIPSIFPILKRLQKKL